MLRIIFRLAKASAAIGLALLAFSSLGSAASEREYSAVAVRAKPDLKCTLDTGETQVSKPITLYSNDDGYVRFHAVRATAPDDVRSVTINCVDPVGHRSSYVADLSSAEVFEPHPLDVSLEPGTDRPVLMGNPMNYSLQELIREGYGLRPDPAKAPDLYRQWLLTASRPMRTVSMKRFPASGPAGPSAATQNQPKPLGVAGAQSSPGGWWSGARLQGSPTYSRIVGLFVVPTALPGAIGTTYTSVSIWSGINGSTNDLVQSGIDMATTPTVASYSSFREVCCGNTTSTNVGFFNVSPGDQISTNNWYCDAQGNPNIKGGYGCSIVLDLTTGQQIYCVLAKPANGDCPSATILAPATVGRTAEFIVENMSPQFSNTPTTQWPAFTPRLEMDGYAYSDKTQTWLDVDTDPNVVLLTDGVNDPTDTIVVSIAAPDSTFWSVKPTPVPQIQSIWRSNGNACAGASCGSGWIGIDDNPATASIFGGSSLVQLHTDGSLWRWNGRDCTGSSCFTWDEIDNNPQTLAAVSSDQMLYQLHRNGEIFRFTGSLCDKGFCPGWIQLDQNPSTIAIAAGQKNYLYQLHATGEIWQYTPHVCGINICPGWTLIDGTPGNVAIAADGTTMYRLLNDGEIWNRAQNGYASLLDRNPAAVAIAAAGGNLYQQHRDGTVWKYTNSPCVGQSCPGWVLLDNNPATRKIVANGSALFQLHANGEVWKWKGLPCDLNGCAGKWTMLDNNPKTTQITAMGGVAYQLHGHTSIPPIVER